MTKHVQPGLNALAVAATNGSDQPNPAGLIGRFAVEFEQGSPLEGRIDKTWKTSRQKQEGWTDVKFDASRWASVLESVDFGKGPWGSFQDRQLAVSPVAAADPFRGRFTIPVDVDRAKCRVFLEMKDLPDDSAAVSINGEYAGGVIGRPGRLDITRCVKTGENKVFIEPLTPKSVRIVIY